MRRARYLLLYNSAAETHLLDESEKLLIRLPGSIMSKHYFPPLDKVCKAIGISAEQLDRDLPVVIPGKLLRALLASAISDLELDVDEYLAGNPDIAASLPGKDADQIERHFKTVGYFEDRLMPLRFDPSFYLREYPDVACELDEGKLSHPKEHFVHCGTHEWRAPNPMARHEVTFWRGLLESGAGEQAQVAVAESHELAGELSADTASRSGSHRAF